MGKIVIGSDSSGEARDALRLGSRLAEALRAELIVAAAFGPVLGAAGFDLVSVERDYFDAVFSQAEHDLGATAFERRELRDVSAPRGLDRLADSEEVDLIVVGSTRRGPVGRVLFGSVGERLLYGAPCPVAIAPRGYAEQPAEEIETVGVAYDGGDESKLALARAQSLAEGVGAKLRLITVIFEWLYVPETSPSRSLEEFMEAERRDKREMQQRAAEAIGDSVCVATELGEGDPASVLAERGQDLDLLVIGSRGYGPVRRTLLGGVSAGVMRNAPCPVVVVPRSSGAG